MTEVIRHSIFGDIQLALFFTYFLYLHFRKRLRTFLNLSLAGYGFLLISFIYGFQKGEKLLVLVISLTIGLISSHKEIMAIDTKGLDAKTVIKPDLLDIIVLLCFCVIGAVMNAKLL